MRLFPDITSPSEHIIMSIFVNKVLELMTFTAATSAAALPVDESNKEARLQFIEQIINLFGTDVKGEEIKRRIAANLPRVMKIEI